MDTQLLEQATVDQGDGQPKHVENEEQDTYMYFGVRVPKCALVLAAQWCRTMTAQAQPCQCNLFACIHDNMCMLCVHPT